MPARRRALVLLLGLTVVAAALLVVVPQTGAEGDEGRLRGAVVTEVGGVVDGARTTATRAPSLLLLLFAVLGVAGPVAPHPRRPAPAGRAASHPRPVRVRAAAGRAPPLPSPITAR